MKRKLFKITTVAIVILALLSTICFAGNSTGFNDVLDNAWYTEGISFCKSKGFMTGYNKTVFGTEDKLTRAEFVTILYRIAGKLPSSGYYVPFEDVNEKDFYGDAVKWAYYNNIVTGYNSSKFGTNDPITRQDLAVILNRVAGADEFTGNYVSNFKDTNKVYDYAKVALKWANYNGIITGKGGTLIDPTANTTRAEAATMIMRYYKKFYSEGSDLSNLSLSRQNALKSARNYISYMAFSKEGLVDQLIYEEYSESDARFAVKNIGVDWMEQATKMAKNYLEYMSFSRDGLIEQLKYEKFTDEEAEHGVSSVGY